jgi:hypothetical protein
MFSTLVSSVLYPLSAVCTVIALKPSPGLVIRERRLRKHADEQMKVVTHQAKAQHLGEIHGTQPLDEGEKILLLSTIEVSLLGWLAQNHATAGVLLGLGAFLVAVAFAAGVVWVNLIVYRLIRKLREI